jgi:2-C-methyl-D-erythritol 4-phosphate cytidylyltransferase
VYHSYKTLQATGLIDIFVVVYNNENQLNFINKYLAKPAGLVFFTPGGPDRKTSVWHELQFLKNSFNGISRVFIHDGARPLVTEKNIVDLNKKIKSNVAAVLYHKIVDTMVSIDRKQINYLDRNCLYSLETPQAFDFLTIYNGYADAIAQEMALIDDSSAIGNRSPIQFVENETSNLKLTYPEDLMVASALLINRQASNSH